MKMALIAVIISTFYSTQSQGQANANADVISYMSYLSSNVVRRPLKISEVDNLRARGADGIAALVDTWVAEPAFAETVRVYIETLMFTSGSAGGIDFSLPGNLAKTLAQQQRPYSELLTASTCYNGNGQSIACDSGAPFSAGILSTRAFLVAYSGAYNIRRAGKIAKKFLCTTYPFSDQEEPRIPVADLIDQFATTAGTNGFGNGNNCYSCHSQFGHHTQLFVKFDATGNYRANATGLQLTGATDGFAANGLYTSHFRSTTRAASEASQILGQPVANLAAAANVITKSPRFLPCAAENMMRHYFRLSDQQVLSIKSALFAQIADQAKVLRADPSFSHLLKALITNPHVISSFKKSGALP